MFRLLLAASLGLVTSTCNWAEDAAKKPSPGLLDITPAAHCVMVGIHDINSLIKAGDDLIAKTKIDIPVRLSQVFDWGFQWLGVQTVVDRDGCGAIILLPYTKDERRDFFRYLERRLVVAVPIKDWTAAAKSLDVSIDDLKAGKVLSRKTANDIGKQVAKIGNHLYFSMSKDALGSIKTFKPSRKQLPKHVIADADGAEIVVSLGTTPWGPEWSQFVEEGKKAAKGDPKLPETQLAKLLVPAIEHLQYGVFTLRVNTNNNVGVTFRASAVFGTEKDKKTAKPIVPKAVAGFLGLVSGGKNASHLRGLPSETESAKVLFAQAARGNGEQTAFAAQHLLRGIADEIANEFGGKTKWLTDVGNATMAGVLGELWSQLNGDRLALYSNKDHRFGAFSLLAILEPDDAAKFIKSLKEIATFVSTDDPGLKRKLPEGVDEKRILALLKDLGSRTFRARRSATLKLSLLGQSAVPYLEKATKSSDAEVAARARTLLRQIQRSQASRNEILLKGEAIIWEPKFAYYQKGETRGGVPIDVLKFSFHDRQKGKATIEAQLKKLLGPDWQSARVAVVGSGKTREVIFFAGSNTELLDKAIANLQKKQAGLRSDGLLKPFHATATKAERRLQVHLSFDRLFRMLATPEDKLPKPPKTPATSSFSLSVFQHSLRADLNFPITEIITIIAKNRRFLRIF